MLKRAFKSFIHNKKKVSISLHLHTIRTVAIVWHNAHFRHHLNYNSQFKMYLTQLKCWHCSIAASDGERERDRVKSGGKLSTYLSFDSIESSEKRDRARTRHISFTAKHNWNQFDSIRFDSIVFHHCWVYDSIPKSRDKNCWLQALRCHWEY